MGEVGGRRGRRARPSPATSPPAPAVPAPSALLPCLVGRDHWSMAPLGGRASAEAAGAPCFLFLPSQFSAASVNLFVVWLQQD